MEISDKAKEARRKYNREWRSRNIDHVRSYAREWRNQNPEKVYDYMVRYWEKKANSQDDAE